MRVLRGVAMLSLIHKKPKPKMKKPGGNMKIIRFFTAIWSAIQNIRKNGLGWPNEDVDTGLDYSPIPDRGELKAAALKLNIEGKEL